MSRNRNALLLLATTAITSICFQDKEGTVDVTETCAHGRLYDSGESLTPSLQYAIDINEAFVPDQTLYPEMREVLSYRDSAALQSGNTSFFRFEDNGNAIVITTGSEDGITDKKFDINNTTRKASSVYVYASR